MATIGVVVPVYQGEPTLDELHRQVTAQLTALTADWEIVYVDDGSRDRSWPMLERSPPPTRASSAIKLIRNYGEHVAITAGLDHSDADHTLIMACDLQDDPAAIPAIVEAARQTGADLVLTRRLKRQDPLLKRLAARIFYAVVQFFVKVRYDHRVGNYRGLSRRGVHLLPRVPRADAERQRDHGDHGRADHDHRRAAPGRAPPAAAATRCTAPPGSPSTCWSATPRCRCSWW